MRPLLMAAPAVLWAATAVAATPLTLAPPSDGVAARLFPRVYDFDSGRFRPVMSPLPEPGIEKLVARRGDPAMPAGRPVGGFHWIAASSTRASGGDARGLGSPVELNDGDVATTWAE